VSEIANKFPVRRSFSKLARKFVGFRYGGKYSQRQRVKVLKEGYQWSTFGQNMRLEGHISDDSPQPETMCEYCILRGSMEGDESKDIFARQGFLNVPRYSFSFATT